MNEPPAPPTAISVLDLTLASIFADLALDEALLVEAEERGGGPVLRFWEPERPSVVLGASGRLHQDVDVEACRRAGVAIARRSSGGGTVVVGPGCLNVTLVLPADAAPGLAAVDTAQAYVLGRIARAIRTRGPEVEVLGSGDLVLGRRKFSGSAQRRLRRHFLVHLSILYNFDLGLISAVTRQPLRQPAYREGRPHEEFLTNVPLAREELRDTVRLEWAAGGEVRTCVDYPADLVAELVATKFADPGWIERL